MHFRFLVRELEREAGLEDEAFCLHCRQKRRFLELPRPRRAQNGRQQLVGKCAVCKTRMSVFITPQRSRDVKTFLWRHAIPVSAEVKAHIAEAAEVGGIPQADIIRVLVTDHLDALTVKMGQALVAKGVRLGGARQRLLDAALAHVTDAEKARVANGRAE